MALTIADSAPTILALDFDGVLCDGLAEYFETAWRVYCEMWSVPDRIPPKGLADQFSRMRPVVETGWEMPVVLRSLRLGVSEADILRDWATIAQQQIAADGLTPARLAAAVDRVRDEWIAADLENWLSYHRFYPGVVDRLQQILASGVYPVIITTKEGRFVRQLLRQQAIDFPDSQIWGKAVKQPKTASLRQLTEKGVGLQQPARIWFVEDRLKTLQLVQQQPDLAAVRLFLADWGYNTAAERDAVSPPIRLLSLNQFAQDYSYWQLTKEAL